MAFLERLLALLFIIALLPLWILAALFIVVEGWLDPEAKGPVLIKERRLSRGKPFDLFK